MGAAAESCLGVFPNLGVDTLCSIPWDFVQALGPLLPRPVSLRCSWIYQVQGCVQHGERHWSSTADLLSALPSQPLVKKQKAGGARAHGQMRAVLACIAPSRLLSAENPAHSGCLYSVKSLKAETAAHLPTFSMASHSSFAHRKFMISFFKNSKNKVQHDFPL